MARTTRGFDASEYLDTPETRAEYLSAAMETGDADFIKEAVGDIIRARGMTAMAKESGVSRASLYRAFGEGGNPTLDSMMAVLDALNLRLSAVNTPEKKAPAKKKAKAVARKRSSKRPRPRSSEAA